MDFGVLGPLAAWDADRELDLGPAKQRCVLAVLLLRANTFVPTATLEDELWGERPPARAAKSVQVYVSQLRKVLGDGVIETRPGGYLLRVGEGALDLEQFDDLLGRGRALLASGENQEAAATLREALALWRGPALADLQDESFARDEIGRLEELRLAALTLRLEADLALGRHVEVVPELEALIRENPLRERPRELLILALYRSGRQADALAAYSDARTMLVDELGLDPGQSLRDLESAILRQDPSLDLAAAAPRLTERQTGTVTFLFTDVDGSTRLVKQLRDRYPAVLADHQRLVREAFSRYGGKEVDTQGDAFFYVFTRARDAAAAAADGQRALQAHIWPEDGEVRVRMGLHTGEAAVSEAGYHGMGVHRAARIMAAGHGGQILASQATAAMLADDSLPGVAQRDLGEYQLKDLDHPERLYQLDVEGLPADFPPLRIGDAPTAYAGKEDELVGGARQPFYRRPVVIGALAGVLAVAVAIPVFALGGDSGGNVALAAVQDNAVGVVDARSRAIVDEAPGIDSPQRVAAGEGSIWVTTPNGDGTVVRLDPESHDVVDTIEVGNGPVGIAVGGGAVWVANSGDGTVSRIDPTTSKQVAAIPVGNTPTGVDFGNGAVWVTNTDDHTISKINPSTSTAGPPIDVGVAARWIAVGGGAVWVTDTAGNTLVRIDPRTGAVTKSISVGSGPTAVDYGNGFVWVTNSLDGTVSRIDARQEIETGRFPVGAAPNGIVVAPDGIWVSLEVGGALVHLDPITGAPASTTLGGRPAGLVLADGSLWIAVQAAGDAHRGGILRTFGYTDSIDPALGYTPGAGQLLSNVYDGLVGYKRVGGVEGNRLVPDLASAVPTPTDGGKTYTFRLREGIKFSDGTALKASAVRSSFERIFKAHSPVPQFYEGILGGHACRARPERCNLLKGVITDDETGIVIIKLSKPDNDFLHKLALTLASIVPPGTPPNAQTPIPGTGPYQIAENTPLRRVRLVRNPHFEEWSKEAQPGGNPDEILVDSLADYSLWLSVQAAGAGRGGTTRMSGYIDQIDPALSEANAAGPLHSLVYDGLVGHDKAGSAAGNTLVPDLAISLPRPTDHGRKYTFRLREGITFSNGRPLEAAAVRSSLERLFKAGAPFLDSFAGIVGGPACSKRPERCNLSKGVVTNDETGIVSITLLAPDPDFLDKLTSAFIVPTDTPATSKSPIPGTGPYLIAEYDPNRRVRLVRNRHFEVWSKAAQPAGNPDEIVLTLSKSGGDAALTEVQRGGADLAQQGAIPPSRFKQVRTRYAAQFYVTPRAGVIMFALNIHRPPFDNELARRAVAFALDRARLLRGFGGSELASTTCQVLPPQFPAYDRYCPFTLGPTEDGAWTAPDLEAAHKLVAESGTTNMRVEILGTAGKFEDDDFAASTIVLQHTLEELGYRTSVSYDSVLDAFYIPKPRGEATLIGWFPDYWTPAGFLTPLLCDGDPYACDPAIDQKARNALALQGRDPQAATAAWRSLEREVVDRAIVVPFVTPTALDFVSKRVGNFQRHPFYGTLISQLWVDEGTL